jgi:hypothetical protein
MRSVTYSAITFMHNIQIMSENKDSIVGIASSANPKPGVKISKTVSGHTHPVDVI